MLLAMKMLKFLLALALFAVVARAGDAANLEFLGFSKDGRYLAFEQYGIQDGSGFAYASVSVVDTTKNLLVKQASSLIEREEAKVSQARAGLNTSSLLRTYGIVAGNQGRFVGIAPQAPNIQGQRSQFIYGGRTHELELLSEFVDVDEKVCVDKIQARLELRLTVSNVAGKPRTLQKDGVLPASRACARSYEMKSAHILGNTLVVFVVVHLPGFEGSDLRWMAITAKL
jgi:predicted secreted protein